MFISCGTQPIVIIGCNHDCMTGRLLDENAVSGDLLVQNQEVIEPGSLQLLSNSCLTEGAEMTLKRGECPENDSAITHIGQEGCEQERKGTKT